MAGITDSAYRRIARRFGAGLLYTECISAEGTRRLGEASLELARFQPEERPIAVQLFGSDPDQFADAAAVITEKFAPDLIDINCGCPVKRFVTRKCGGYLMQQPDLIGRIVEAVRTSCGLPVSIKLRSGYRRPEETAAEAAVAAKEAGASIVAIHGRYVRGASGTRADWDVIARVREAIPEIPVFGNGDIYSDADVQRMIIHTNVDRVMIGRWAQGRPWIFRGLGSARPNEAEPPEPSNGEKIGILTHHYKLLLEQLPERQAVRRMRKHIGWYSVGMPGSAKLRCELMKIDESDAVLSRLEEYAKNQHFSSPSDTVIAWEHGNFDCN